MKHWRRTKIATVLATVSGLAAALTGGGVLSAPPSGASTKTFVIADTSSVQKIDPDVVTNFLDFEALGLIYQPLVQMSPQLVIKPDLATKWAWTNNGLDLTLQLRHGVKFDSGTPFTSADAVASLKRAVAAKTADPSASFIASVKTIAADGPYAIKLTLCHRDASVLEGLTTLNMAMMPAAAIANGSIAKHPDGTGPFMFSSWSPGNSFSMVANPHYWGGKVSLPSVKIITIASEQSIAAALEAGTIQMGDLTQPTVVSSLPKSIKVSKALSLSYRVLQMQDNQPNSPLDNVNNRLAIECATNRKQIIADALSGQGQPSGPVPLGPFASKPVSAICPTQNLAKAKAYLAAAGNPNGFSFTAMTSDALDSTSAAQATTLQAQLAQVGITMTINNLDSNSYIQDWLAGKFQAAFAENGADPNHYVMYDRYYGAGASLKVPSGYVNPTIQKFLAAGDLATTLGAQKAAWARVSAFLTSHAVWDWLFDAYNFEAMAPNVKGFTASPVTSGAFAALATTHLS
jgi:peptide/nickel transport system substrate-binding protein